MIWRLLEGYAWLFQNYPDIAGLIYIVGIFSVQAFLEEIVDPIITRYFLRK